MGTVRLFEHKNDPLDEARARFGVVPIRAGSDGVDRSSPAGVGAHAARPQLLPVGRVHDRAHRRRRARPGAQPADGDAVDTVLEVWAPYAAAPAVAFVGGPVQQHEAVIGLARSSRERRSRRRRRVATADRSHRHRRPRSRSAGRARRPRGGAHLRRVLGVGPVAARERARRGRVVRGRRAARRPAHGRPRGVVAHGVAPTGRRSRRVRELSARRRRSGCQLTSFK